MHAGSVKVMKLLVEKQPCPEGCSPSRLGPSIHRSKICWISRQYKCLYNEGLLRQARQVMTSTVR